VGELPVVINIARYGRAVVGAGYCQAPLVVVVHLDAVELLQEVEHQDADLALRQSF